MKKECKNCNKIREHKGLGLCASCYRKHYFTRPGKRQERSKTNKKSREKCKIECVECGNVRSHIAQGLCSNCYNKGLYMRQPTKRMKSIRSSLYGKKATAAFYEAVEAQGSKCLICEETKDLVLDHDHETGIFRGAICHKCNVGLGMLNDDVDILQRALNYLKGSLGKVTLK